MPVYHFGIFSFHLFLCLKVVFVFIQQIFLQLLCARYCLSWQIEKKSCPHGTYVPLGSIITQWSQSDKISLGKLVKYSIRIDWIAEEYIDKDKNSMYIWTAIKENMWHMCRIIKRGLAWLTKVFRWRWGIPKDNIKNLYMLW